MKMKPIYPIEIIVDEGICRNISSRLLKIVSSIERENHFIIGDEDIFCRILQMILSDRKVRYIINELQRREMDEKKEKHLSNKVIICEGQTDEIILQAIAQKLNHEINIVSANGKHNVPAIFNAVKGKNMNVNILIVIDSDGDEENIRTVIVENIGEEGYELVIINNCIEDWFMPKVADFSKLKLIQSIDAIVEESDFNILCKEHESFAKVTYFIKK